MRIDMNEMQEKAIKIWEYICENPMLSKPKAYKELRLKYDHAHCPCCEIAGFDENNETLCKKCPCFGQWITNDYSLTDMCINDDSAYWHWFEYRDKRSAELVLKTIKENWNSK